jgi:hypothetical protein
MIFLAAISCVRHASAQLLTPTTAPVLNWSSIASSADGITVVAVATDGPIYTSYDAGATWISNSLPLETWTSVAGSADGSKLVAVALGGSIYTSSNSGANWVSNNVSPADWTSVASSADGTKLIAAGDTGIYRSTDSGVTWIQITAPSNTWQSVACSADGVNLLAACLPDPDARVVYTSTNSGSTWTASDIPPDYPRYANHYAVASSADGGTMVVAATFGFLGSVDGGIYFSMDFGVTWAEATASLDECTSISLSADGAKLYAFGTFGCAYSTNSGVSWKGLINLQDQLIPASSSADGTKVFLAWGAASMRSRQITPDHGARLLGRKFCLVGLPRLATEPDGPSLVTSAQTSTTWGQFTHPRILGEHGR